MDDSTEEVAWDMEVGARVSRDGVTPFSLGNLDRE